jgi:hypothetical protein
MEIFNSLNHANFNPPTANNQIFRFSTELVLSLAVQV